MIRHIPLSLLPISGLAVVSCERTRLTPTAPSLPEALIGRFMLTHAPPSQLARNVDYSFRSRLERVAGNTDIAR